MNLFKKLLGGGSEGEVRRIMKTVAVINSLEPRYQAMSHRELIDETSVLKKRAQEGESLDAMLPEAFALLREGTVRSLSKRQFDVQLVGGIVLHQGRIAEMKTGEGKTYCAPLAAFLNALEGKGAHVVTVNDYLAKYHGEMIGKVFRYLGMSCGIILHDLDNNQRREAYACDVTYGTNNEFGFDYLRDNMVVYKEDMVQRGHRFAIVDEVDSILIDEARTPLIISGAGDKSTELYTLADRFVARLREGEEADFTKDEKQKTINLTEKGVGKAESAFSLDNLADPDNAEYSHHINQALRARFLMARDRDYVVQDGQVVIVDEFTGRLMTGRRYSDGLHQAIEAKENVKVERESKTLATITFQNYFRMYSKLAGMTGTAKTEEEEFKSIYGLDVVEIPTNKPMIREDFNDLIYKTESGKYAAVVEEIIEKHKKGQPVLVGTVSVEKSEYLSHMLGMRGVKHEVLNAKHHQKEAEIVAQAGKAGAVTIATNMAGRGTDILLGGNAEFLARREMRKREFADELIEEATGHAETEDADILGARKTYSELLAQYEKQTDSEHDIVEAGGGLHIIGTERHESRRIDNQLRGRAGRQGDRGSSRFYLSLEDDLLRLFGSDRISGIVDKLGLEEDQPIEYGVLSRQIENAQKRVEGRNFDSRRHVLQYDDVMNQQREIIYSQRRKVLSGENMRDNVMEMLEGFIGTAVDMVTGGGKSSPDEWDVEGLIRRCEGVFLPKGALSYTPDEVDALTPEALKERLSELGQEEYARREAKITEYGANMRDVERTVVLRAVDSHWMDHIDAMDQLRSGIGLRAFAQRNPIVEYKFEGFEMFDEMVHSIQEDTLRMLFHLTVDKDQSQRRRVAEPMRATHGEEEGAPRRRSSSPARAETKVGRNDPCPCGSGKKYKNCHGAAN